MPRVKPLTKRDPREIEMLEEIGGIKTALRLSDKELAKHAGISASTLSRLIGKNGNIGDMKMSVYWKIQDARRRAGV